MRIKNNSGFGAVGIIIAVIVLAVVGGIGWSVSHKTKVAAPAKATTAEDTGTSTNAAVDGSTKYLTISEWGVKFALTADTSDAYYDAASASAMSLRVHSLDSEVKCKSDPLSIAGIHRVAAAAEDPSLPGKMYSDTQTGKTIGDYFYYIQGAQTQCASSVDAKITLQGVLNSFNTAGPSIQKS